jgi:hypothetical protein
MNDVIAKALKEALEALVRADARVEEAEALSAKLMLDLAEAEKEIDRLRAVPMDMLARQWEGMETAPRDGRAVLLLSKAYAARTYGEEGGEVHYSAKCAIGCWCAEGTSWTDEFGGFEGEICTLSETGVWYSGGGWFQPNEVTHWMALPGAPEDGK